LSAAGLSLPHAVSTNAATTAPISAERRITQILSTRSKAKF
jgi:hypothetical protein